MNIPNLKNVHFPGHLLEKRNKLALSGVSIQTDWYVLLALTLGILVVLLIGSVNLYVAINDDLTAIEAEQRGKVAMVHERRMRVVLDDLLERRHIPAVVPAPAATSTSAGTNTTQSTESGAEPAVDGE